MIFMFSTTYAESLISIPNFGSGASRGPMQNGITNIGRPSMEPLYSGFMMRFMSRGCIQLFSGPASSSRCEQMKVWSSTRATSSGSVRT